MRTVRILDFIASLLLGVGLGIVTVVSWNEMPEYRLWTSIDYPLATGFPNSTAFGMIHLLLGVFTFTIGIYIVVEIVRVNQRAQAGKNNPTHLLTDGFYSKVRHPMTGMFITILVGVMVSLCSVIGLVIIILFVLFFHGTTLYEEKTWLLPRFGQDYHNYMNEVPKRYFSNVHTIFLILIFLFSSIGIIF